LSFKKYARYYDLIYKDKNYVKECDFVERIFKRYSHSKPVTVLEMACGTGRHSEVLSKKGYKITAFDASQDMIEIARKRKKKKKITVNFSIQKMQNFRFKQKFDAALAMFTAMGYLSTIKDLKKTLTNLRKHLNEGNLFVFDIWNGDIVPKAHSADRIKEIEYKDLKLKRNSRVRLDLVKKHVLVQYKVSIFRKGKLIDQVKEKHTLRFYKKIEIKKYLKLCGFSVINIVPFLKPNSRNISNAWDICIICRAL